MSHMEGRSLQAPWRMDYIRSLDKADDAGGGGCFLCAAANAASDAERRNRVVLWTTDHSVVLINRYPYTNGHILIAPRAHKADFEELSDAEQLDLAKQSTRVIQVLKRALSPQGFNLGTNLGRCAGAGLPGHLHQHVVPRWAGDTNFMSVVGDVRVVPQAISQLYDELMRVLPSV
jgi:ATP adenylyltransferase